jgi:hypothetical protein
MNAQQQLLETQVAAEDLARLLEQAVGLAQKAALQVTPEMRAELPGLRSLAFGLVSLSARLDCEKAKLLMALGMPPTTEFEPKHAAHS